MTKLFKTNQKPNFMRVVFHTSAHAYSCIGGNFAEALKAFVELGPVPEDIRHVDISYEKIDSITFDD